MHLFAQKNLERANDHFEQLLTKYPNSPRALYGKALSLDKLAEKQRSNKMLEEAIATFQKVMDAKDTPDELFKQAGLKLGEKLEFRGNKHSNSAVNSLFYASTGTEFSDSTFLYQVGRI